MQPPSDPSKRITHLAPEWHRWIQNNLARRCPAESLIEKMVEQNFDPEFAASSVYRLAGDNGEERNPAPPIRDDSRYRYETPRLPQSGNVIRTPDRQVRVALRMTRPVVAVFDNLLSAEECDELIRRARLKLKRSTIVDPATGQEAIIQDRSSHGCFFPINEDAFIARLDARIAALMHWPLENGEGIQILHYQEGEQYTPHFDYFPASDPGSAVHLARGGQRVSTLVIYLNDVEEGGETIFPDIGLSILPKKGAAAYFEYCNSQNQVDPLTLHAGGPVISGEKWIATKWMRQYPLI